MRPTVRRPGKMFIHLNAKRLYVQMNEQSVVPRGGIEPPYHVPQTCVLPLNYNGMNWLRVNDSNKRFPGYEPSEMTTSLTRIT